MKKITVILICLLSLFKAGAQTQNPISWMASYKAISATEGEITITALIEKNWHTYSQRPTNDGPVPTTFTFPASKQFQLLGKTEESEAHETFDQTFGTKIFAFSDK